MIFPSEADERLPAETHLGRTALRVEDLEEPIEFYRSVVGLRLLARVAGTAIQGVDERPLLVLETGAAGRTEAAAGLFRHAFRVPSRRGLGNALGRVRKRWPRERAADHRVSEAVFLSDPEGKGSTHTATPPAMTGRSPPTVRSG
ncbi:MAG: VOC family protein [Haloarculaceae archaeon]